MKLYSKKEYNLYIVVATKKNQIIVKNGFVIIEKGNHFGHTTIRPDLLEALYDIPSNISFKE